MASKRWRVGAWRDPGSLETGPGLRLPEQVAFLAASLLLGFGILIAPGPVRTFLASEPWAGPLLTGAILLLWAMTALGSAVLAVQVGWHYVSYGRTRQPAAPETSPARAHPSRQIAYVTDMWDGPEAAFASRYANDLIIILNRAITAADVAQADPDQAIDIWRTTVVGLQLLEELAEDHRRQASPVVLAPSSTRKHPLGSPY